MKMKTLTSFLVFVIFLPKSTMKKKKKELDIQTAQKIQGLYKLVPYQNSVIFFF